MVEKAAKGLPAPQGEGFGGGVCNDCYQPRFLNTDPTPAPPLHGRGVNKPPLGEVWRGFLFGEVWRGLKKKSPPEE